MNILTYSKNVKYGFVKSLLRNIKSNASKSKVLDLAEQSYNDLLSERFLKEYSNVGAVGFYQSAVDSLNDALARSRQLAKSKQRLVKKATPSEFNSSGFYGRDFTSQLPYDRTFVKECPFYKYISANNRVCHVYNVGWQQDCMDGHSLNAFTSNLLTYVNPDVYRKPLNFSELDDVELCSILSFNNYLAEYRGSFSVCFLVKRFTQNKALMDQIILPAEKAYVCTYKPSKNLGYIPEDYITVPTTDEILKTIAKIR